MIAEKRKFSSLDLEGCNLTVIASISCWQYFNSFAWCPHTMVSGTISSSNCKVTCLFHPQTAADVAYLVDQNG